jgi:hypothetical protein
MRGTGEGHYSWELRPQSMMTNANVEQVGAIVSEGIEPPPKQPDGSRSTLEVHIFLATLCRDFGRSYGVIPAHQRHVLDPMGLPAHAQAKLSCCHHRSSSQDRSVGGIG